MKYIIVTGDSKGLGAEITNQILTNTSFGVIGLSRSVTADTEKNLSVHKNRYVPISFDLINTSEIKELYLNKIKKIGPIFGLVNNSAVAYDDLITNADLELLENMFMVNFSSVVFLTKYAIRDMLLNKTQGSIVNISSICAHTGYKGLSMYAASKGAMEAFTKNAAREWGRVGIRINSVAPGFMETNMSQGLSDSQRGKIYSRTALGKETSMESVAKTVLFLLSNESSSITGKTIQVDSGTL